jgi:hypothetical protein
MDGVLRYVYLSWLFLKWRKKLARPADFACWSLVKPMRHRPQKKGSREKEKDRRRLDEEGRQAFSLSLIWQWTRERERGPWRPRHNGGPEGNRPITTYGPKLLQIARFRTHTAAAAPAPSRQRSDRAVARCTARTLWQCPRCDCEERTWQDTHYWTLS